MHTSQQTDFRTKCYSNTAHKTHIVLSRAYKKQMHHNSLFCVAKDKNNNTLISFSLNECIFYVTLHPSVSSFIAFLFNSLRIFCKFD